MSQPIGIISLNFSSYNSIVETFKKEGFTFINYDASNQNWESNFFNLPTVLFLDLTLGYTDGIELCERIKTQRSNTILIIFSDEKEDFVEIEAYKAGVDDFLTKNINPKLLLKKINAFLRRKSSITKLAEERIINYQTLIVNRDRYLVQKGEEEISLQKKQFELLFLLISNPKKTFSRDELYQAVWEVSEANNPRIIDVHIRKIREKIGENIIITIKGNGYKIAS